MFIFKRQKNFWSCFNKLIIDYLIKLNLFIQLKNWINNFMNNRLIALAFDDQKQHTRQIKIDISQKLSISSILFLIYIWFLFSKIRIKTRISSFNFINDIQISVSSKNIVFFYWFRFIVRMQSILITTDFLSKYNFSEFL